MSERIDISAETNRFLRQLMVIVDDLEDVTPSEWVVREGGIAEPDFMEGIAVSVASFGTPTSEECSRASLFFQMGAEWARRHLPRGPRR